MIQFLKYKFIYFAISAVVIGSGLVSILVYGFNISIDFSGGTVVEYSFSKNIDRDEIKGVIDQNKIKLSSIQTTGKNNILLKMEAINQQKEGTLRNALTKKTNAKITVLRVETVGPV